MFLLALHYLIYCAVVRERINLMCLSSSVEGTITGATFTLQLKDLLIKTCLNDRNKALIGPFCCSVQLEAKWCMHSGSPDPFHSVPKVLADMKAGLIQVCVGGSGVWQSLALMSLFLG